MTTMRAMVTAGPGDYDVMRLQEVPRPVPGPQLSRGGGRAGRD